MTVTDTENNGPDRETYIQKHLDALQGIIQRMAANSSAAKNWCLTMVTALLALGMDRSCPALILISLVPTLMFMALDVYYLAMERRFVDAYGEKFVKAAQGALTVSELAMPKLWHDPQKQLLSAASSFSVYGFYGVIAALMIVLASVVYSLVLAILVTAVMAGLVYKYRALFHLGRAPEQP